jgi:2,4-dienoyl-CoA reductase-like NADH-dependent reductase (Old Yellow Enzyme family)
VKRVASLLSPIKIKRMLLKNRIVMPPMATELATESGEVTDALVAHYDSRCGSLGLMIVEHSYIRSGGKFSERQLGIYSDELVSGLSRIAESAHKKDTPIAIQINHAGRRATSKICGTQPVAPSPIPDPESEESPRELTIDEINILVRNFGLAARRAVKAGFDAVEIHGAHGFLLGQFCSPVTNRRTDRYGGPSKNRMRLSIEVSSEVLKTAGKDVPIFYRLGADDMTPGGLTLEEAKSIAKSLAKLGISVIDVSGGLCGSRPPNLSGEGYFTHLAQGIKQVVKVPVITTGGIRAPSFADEIVRRGIADLVGVGRPLLSNPEWATKAVKALKEQL